MQEVRVSNETELLQAVTDHAGVGCRIIQTDNITLTADRTLNLSNISLDSNNNTLIFNGKSIICSGGYIDFSNIKISLTDYSVSPFRLTGSNDGSRIFNLVDFTII